MGISAGYLGSLMVLKKMALVGDAFSHVALPGLALGLLFNFPVFIGAFAVLFVSAVVVWHLGRVTRLSYESIVGATFTLALAVGILMVVNGQLDLLESLFGDITSVTLLDTMAAVAISIAAILLTKVIYKKLVLGMISEDLAISKGISVSMTDLLYLLLVSMVVAIGIKIVGSLLVGFLVAVPAASAKNVGLKPSQVRIDGLDIRRHQCVLRRAVSELLECSIWTHGGFRGYGHFCGKRILEVAGKMRKRSAYPLFLLNLPLPSFLFRIRFKR